MKTAALAITLLTADSESRDKQWVHLLPSGSFRGRDGRGPWFVRDATAVIQASLAYAGGKDLPFDFDHAIDLSKESGQQAIASGWIEGLEARADGIWGLVTWTKRAAEHLNNREYRYVSPVFNYTKTGDVVRLLRAGLTNDPALVELKAVAAAEGEPMEDDLGELRKLLGLDEQADMAAIVAKVQELLTAQQSAIPDPAKYVPIATLQTVVNELQGTKRAVTEETVELSVNTAVNDGRLPPSLREWGLALCRSNKPAFDEFVKNTGGVYSHLFSTQTGGKAPEYRGGDHSLTEEQRAVCRNLGHSYDEYTKNLRS